MDFCEETAEGEPKRLMDTCPTFYCWWNSNTKSFSLTITAEGAVQEIRPEETTHFRQILGLCRRKSSQAYSVCFQLSVWRILRSIT